MPTAGPTCKLHDAGTPRGDVHVPGHGPIGYGFQMRVSIDELLSRREFHRRLGLAGAAAFFLPKLLSKRG